MNLQIIISETTAIWVLSWLIVIQFVPWRQGRTNCLFNINPLNTKLNPICHLLALLGARHILHVSRIRVKYVQIMWHLQTSIQLTIHSHLFIQKHEFFMLQRKKTFHLVRTRVNLRHLLSIIWRGHFNSAETRRRWMPSHWPCRWMLFYCNCMSRVFGQLIINLESCRDVPCLVQNGKVITLFAKTSLQALCWARSIWSACSINPVRMFHQSSPHVPSIRSACSINPVRMFHQSGPRVPSVRSACSHLAAFRAISAMFSHLHLRLPKCHFQSVGITEILLAFLSHMHLFLLDLIV